MYEFSVFADLQGTPENGSRKPWWSMERRLWTAKRPRIAGLHLSGSKVATPDKPTKDATP